MNTASTLRAACAATAVLVLAGCGTTNNLSSEQTGRLAGAGTGALIGAVASGGVLLPVIGAISGAIVGEELATPSEPGER